MSSKEQTNVTPEEAANTIRHQHNVENTSFRMRGWRDKVELGRAAFHATKPELIAPPLLKPLTFAEMSKGIEYIEESKSKIADTKELDPEQERKIEKLVDSGKFSYYEARRIISGE